MDKWTYLQEEKFYAASERHFHVYRPSIVCLYSLHDWFKEEDYIKPIRFNVLTATHIANIHKKLGGTVNVTSQTEAWTWEIRLESGIHEREGTLDCVSLYVDFLYVLRPLPFNFGSCFSKMKTYNVLWDWKLLFDVKWA